MTNNWVKGMESPNPLGRSPGSMTWQRYVDRASSVMERYDIEKVLEFAGQINQGVKVPLSTIDGLIVVNIAGALRGEGKERERLLDRLLGKPVQRIGGENPGEGIKIQSMGPQLEAMDSATLVALAELLREAKARALPEPVTIEGGVTVVDSTEPEA